MKNLKRALSFALASVMLVGMMVVGAGAAFTDADEIVNDDAVNTLVALNVINGKGDGSYYDPNGSLTRAEMAKLVVFVLHGGKAPVIGTKATPSFSDIKGNWAEAYIEYCASTGIINGMGDGTFGPNVTLTGSQAAKMLLVAMNYDANVFGLTGADWEINTNVEANKAGLYEDLESMDPTKTITRDQAAQLIYNAIMANTMRLSWGQNMATGEISQNYTATGDSLYNDKFGGYDAEGYLVDATYNSTTEKYTYYIEDALTSGAGVVTLSTTKDFTDLLGLKVKALYKNVDGAVESGYGIYADCDTVTATVGELATVSGSTVKAKLAGVTYKLNANYADTSVYAFTAANGVVDTAEDLDDTTADKASALTLVDTNGDAKYDYAVVAPVTVAKVTYAGTKSITAGANYTFEDHNIADGIAKDDFVVITAAANTVYGKAVIEEVGVINGTVSGIKNTNEILVDGAWYKCAMNAGDAIEINKNFDLVVIGGYYYNAKKISTDAAVDTLVVALDKASVSMGQQSVKFLTAAGEKVVATVNEIGDNDVSSSNQVALNALYTYEVEDGAWKLTAVSNTNKLGYKYATASAYTKKTDNAAAKLGAYLIDDEAMVFIQSTDGDGTNKVITGAALNTWASNVASLSATVLYKTVNGLNYVVAAHINLGSTAVPSATGEVGNYGYVVSAPYTMKVDTTSYDCYDIWNGSAVVTVMDKDNDLALAKGDIIEYTDLGDGIVKSSVKVTAPMAITGFNSAAVAGYLADGTVVGYNLTEDTVYMYVDAENVAGVEGGALALAAENADGSYVMNAWVKVDVNNNVELIVVETANDIGANTVIIP